MIDFPRVRYLLNAVPEAVFRAQREWSRATSGGSMMPDPDPPEGQPLKVYLRPLTCPQADKMENAAIRVSEARERAALLQMELNDAHTAISYALVEKEIEGDAKAVIIHRYFDGYGISKIAMKLYGVKTERERNRVKYLLKATENRLNA